MDKLDFNVALSMSLVAFGFDGVEIQVLIAKKQEEPSKGEQLLPSRFLEASEDLEKSAKKLFSKFFKKQSEVSIEQLRAFGKIDRHPSGRVLNVAFYCLVKKVDFEEEKWDRLGLEWCPKGQIPELLFDHSEMIDYAEERLKRRVKRRPVGFHLLPEEFTLRQLQNLYENALNKTFDKRNFRKKLSKTTLINDLDKTSDGLSHGQRKGSKLYSFNFSEYKKMKIRGYDFLF